MPFELHIALRYLLAKRKQAFISVISLISTLGVTVGVMALVIALALMTGLQEELRDRILGSQPAHLRLEARSGIDRLPRRRSRQAAAGAARRRRGAGDPRARRSSRRPARRSRSSASRASIRRSSRRSPTSSGAMRSGSLDALDTRPTDELAGILLGKDLAAQARRRRRRLGDAADAAGHAVADGHDAAARGGCASPASSASASTSSTRPYGFVSLDVAKRLLDKDQVDLIQLRVDDIYAAPRIADVDSRRSSAPTTSRRTGPT